MHHFQCRAGEELGGCFRLALKAGLHFFSPNLPKLALHLPFGFWCTFPGRAGRLHRAADEVANHRTSASCCNSQQRADEEGHFLPPGGGGTTSPAWD